MRPLTARAFMATLSTAGRIEPDRRDRVPTTYEVHARTKKALAIVHMCEQHGITADEAAGASEDERAMAAQAAGVRVPSQETWAVVVGLLRSRERGMDGNE